MLDLTETSKCMAIHRLTIRENNHYFSLGYYHSFFFLRGAGGGGGGGGGPAGNPLKILLKLLN